MSVGTWVLAARLGTRPSPLAGVIPQEGNEEVLKALEEAGGLLAREPYGHKYPYDWRTKKPTIFRATDQWFASVDRFRDVALDAIDKVTWLSEPSVGRRGDGGPEADERTPIGIVCSGRQGGTESKIRGQGSTRSPTLTPSSTPSLVQG